MVQRPMSLNRYSWVEGNAPNRRDPRGLMETPLGGGGDGGTAIGVSGDTSAIYGGSLQPEVPSDSTALWVNSGGSILDAQIANQSFEPINSIDNFFAYENFMQPGHGLLDYSLLQMNSQQMGSISPDVLTWRDPNQQLVTVTCRLNPLFDINRFLQGEPQYEREGQATPQV